MPASFKFFFYKPHNTCLEFLPDACFNVNSLLYFKRKLQSIALTGFLKDEHDIEQVYILFLYLII